MHFGDGMTREDAIKQAKSSIEKLGGTIIKEEDWKQVSSETQKILWFIPVKMTFVYQYTIEYETNEQLRVITIYRSSTQDISYVPGVNGDFEESYSYKDESKEEIEEAETAEIRTINNETYENLRVSNDPSKILYYINYARLYCNANKEHNAEGLGFTMLYIMLVVMTVMFLFRYLKRVIYVAFLTMIAPLVALTYPLDKIKDRKSTSI